MGTQERQIDALKKVEERQASKQFSSGTFRFCTTDLCINQPNLVEINGCTAFCQSLTFPYGTSSSGTIIVTSSSGFVATSSSGSIFTSSSGTFPAFQAEPESLTETLTDSQTEALAE